MGVMEEYVLGNRKRPTILASVEKRKRRDKLHFLLPAMDRSQERLGFLQEQNVIDVMSPRLFSNTIPALLDSEPHHPRLAQLPHRMEPPQQRP